MNRRFFLKTTAATLAIAALPLATSPILSPVLAQDTESYPKKTATVLGHKLAYIDAGSGRPVVFLHGNPTSSYIWRNILPWVAKENRVIAPDLMGMGDSDKPNMQEAYKETSEYLFAFLDSLKLENAILVVHDWGSGLGFEYARTRPEQIAGIVFMEAMTPPFIPYESYKDLGAFEDFMRAVRTPGTGETMIMENNLLLDQFMRHGSPNGSISESVMTEYNRYYPKPEDRKILLDWLREIPIAGQPAYVHRVATDNNAWLLQSDIPKLMFHVAPGAIISMKQADLLKETLTNLESIFLGKGGHFLQETYSQEISKGIADWVRKI